MDDIEPIIKSIVKGCAKGGVKVSDVTAAYIARTVCEEDTSVFVLDTGVTQDKIDLVVSRSIAKLVADDDPTIETIKMQVSFDQSYHNESVAAQKKIKSRKRTLTQHKNSIIEIPYEDLLSFDSLTSLYRKIFRMLVDFAPNTKIPVDKEVEREIAAALESVFPRVGLKSFIRLEAEEKVAQLNELSRIILGIRLFNREEDRGGAGIDDMDINSVKLASALAQDIEQEVVNFADTCRKYHIAIINGHRIQRQKNYESQIKSPGKTASEQKDDFKSEMKQTRSKEVESKEGDAELKVFDVLDVTTTTIDRWSNELTNRRQYLGYLKMLSAECDTKLKVIEGICEKLRVELATLKELVMDKNSVSKEVVYPRFENAGSLWLELYEEVAGLIAKSNTFQELCKYRLSFTPTLSDAFYNSSVEKLGENVDENNPFYSPMVERVKQYADIDQETDSKDEEDSSVQKEQKSPEMVFTSTSGAVLLNSGNTPDFMLLPLELQGYCPWSLVEARGLLIPGKPALGIVRYMNLYYVFDHTNGLYAFMKDPDYYLEKIKVRAIRHPENIHLLRLYRWFPAHSIMKLMKQYEDMNSSDISGPLTKEAGTMTPTHFVESYIDIDYHWNVWELRRRALRMLNLKNCTTKAMQTDGSHFKRDNETQIYVPRDNWSQTKRDKATNPKIVTTYATGFRGKMVEVDHEGAKILSQPKTGITKLTLDL